MRRKTDFIWDSGWTLSFFGRLFQGVSGRFPSVPETAGETAGPAVDIFENDHSVVVDIEVPGIDPEDLRVRIDGELVSIEGFKRRAKDARCLSFLCLERQYGAFRRMVRIPSSVDTSAVRAALSRGILRIELPRISDRRKSIVEVPITSGPLPSQGGDR